MAAGGWLSHRAPRRFAGSSLGPNAAPEAATSLLPGKPEQARRSVEIIGDTARLALTELRRLLGVLRGPSERLETSPSASLDEIGGVLDQVRGAGLPVDFEVVGTPCPLAPGVDLTAYRGLRDRVQAVILCYETGLVVPGSPAD